MLYICLDNIKTMELLFPIEHIKVLETAKPSPRQERIINVPVPVYVAKVMRKLYGGDVIHACHNTLLGKALATVFVDLPEELPLPSNPLPQESIKIELNYRVAKVYTRWGLGKVFDLGFYYEKTVQRMILTHMIAQVRAGKSIEFAFQDFCNLYDISEDDYARDSALFLYHKYSHNINANGKTKKN
jgi:hypothetical protein